METLKTAKFSATARNSLINFLCYDHLADRKIRQKYKIPVVPAYEAENYAISKLPIFTVEELCILPNIGPHKAKEIIAYLISKKSEVRDAKS